MGDDGDSTVSHRLASIPGRIHRLSIIDAYSDAMSKSQRPLQNLINKNQEEMDNNFDHYVGYPNTLSVISDPDENRKSPWIQRASSRLFCFWISNSLLTAALLSILIFIDIFLPDIYSRERLKGIFFKYAYVNMYLFTGCHFTAIIIGIVFLCYPKRSSWGRLQKIRWMFLMIPITTLVLGLFNHIEVIANVKQIVDDMEQDMLKGLNVSFNTKLAETSQAELECCGVHGWTDWKDIVNSSSTIYYFGYPPTCCNNGYVKGCSIPVFPIIRKEPFNVEYNQLWSEGCLKKEKTVFLTTAILLWALALIMTILPIWGTISLWQLSHHVERHRGLSYHPFAIIR